VCYCMRDSVMASIGESGRYAVKPAAKRTKCVNPGVYMSAAHHRRWVFVFLGCTKPLPQSIRKPYPCQGYRLLLDRVRVTLGFPRITRDNH